MSLKDRMENDPVLVSAGPPTETLELILEDDLDDGSVAREDTLEP